MPYLIVLLLCFSLSLTAQTGIDIDLFPFQNGVSDSHYNTPQKQVQLLLDNDYPGMEKEKLEGFDELYEALKNHNLNLYTIYFKVDLDKPHQPYDPMFEQVLSKLQGSETMFWLHVQSKDFPPSSAEYDRIAVPILQEMADLANRYGIRLMLYPHRWYWVESPEDAIRVAQKVNRRNFGMTFNLCHYLSLEDQNGRDPWERLPALAKASRPYLFAISLNGADASAGNVKKVWTKFIQPLGQGDFDTFRFLKLFVDLGFDGPVGLQCYNIKADKAVHLKQSMQVWKTYLERLKN